MKKKYTLCVSYGLVKEWHQIQKDLEARIAFRKPKLIGSGAGFGMRDLEYEFSVNMVPNKEIADAIVKNVVEFFKERGIHESKVSIKQ